MKYKIGDKVILRANTPLYKSSNALLSSSKLKSQKITNITRVVSGRHPYNTTGDLGWINETDITLYKPAPTPEPVTKYEMEIELVDINGLLDYLKENKNKVIIMKSEDLEKVINNES